MLIKPPNCKKLTCVTKLLKVCVASALDCLISLELITFVTLLASYVPSTRFQAVIQYILASLGFVVSSRELANQNLCKT